MKSWKEDNADAPEGERKEIEVMVIKKKLAFTTSSTSFYIRQTKSQRHPRPQFEKKSDRYKLLSSPALWLAGQALLEFPVSTDDLMRLRQVSVTNQQVLNKLKALTVIELARPPIV
ncbi:hypothetical protein ElyMa_000305600 [Elysia marginata]|uniref:Uncharacterized protein n=1 Tax=Elysia marginata TaxID=1093978 RepID=A0AAV4FAC9_9GAST|nr:hypothetical protein ElyMa_000305600 [Elysia marginata]